MVCNNDNASDSDSGSDCDFDCDSDSTISIAITIAIGIAIAIAITIGNIYDSFSSTFFTFLTLARPYQQHMSNNYVLALFRRLREGSYTHQ